MLLTGAFDRSIDEKARIAIPKRLRDALGCAAGGSLYLAPGADGSIAVYTEESLARIAARVADLPPTHKEVRAYLRLFYSQAQLAEVDRQGRIRIPGHLAELAQLSKDAVLLGVHDHLEIWAADRWRAWFAEKHGSFDEIAEAALRGPS